MLVMSIAAGAFLDANSNCEESAVGLYIEG